MLSIDFTELESYSPRCGQKFVDKSPTWKIQPKATRPEQRTLVKLLDGSNCQTFSGTLTKLHEIKIDLSKSPIGDSNLESFGAIH